MFGFWSSRFFHPNIWCGTSLTITLKSHIKECIYTARHTHNKMEWRRGWDEKYVSKRGGSSSSNNKNKKICIISVFIKGFTFLYKTEKKASGHWNCLNDIYANFSASIFFPSRCSFVHFCVANEHDCKITKKKHIHSVRWFVVIFIVKV